MRSGYENAILGQGGSPGSHVVLGNEESYNVLISVWNVSLAVELHCVNDAEVVGNEIDTSWLWSLRCI